MLKECNLCPRECHIDREQINYAEEALQVKRGYCGEGSMVRLARAALHMWEEPCISGKNGSGAVFFSGCNLKCVFCQNHNIADNSVGKVVSVERLAQIYLELQHKKAQNINLVTGTHFLPQIIESLDLAKKNGLQIPVIYNCGGYESMDSIKKLQGYVDIFLPDFKYVDKELSRNFSNAPDYFEQVTKALRQMVEQTGEPEFDLATGMMKKGVIVRHMILPGHTKDSMKVLDYLYGTYKNKIYISIMNQFTPVVKQERYTELNRTLTEREYEKVINHALLLGIENAFIQEGTTAKESFIPSFDYEGI